MVRPTVTIPRRTLAVECHRAIVDEVAISTLCACPAFVALLSSFATYIARIVDPRKLGPMHRIIAFAFLARALAIEYM